MSDGKESYLDASKQDFLKRVFIEERLLPEKTPDIPGLYFDTYYQSAQEVGGDYFDFIEIDERHLGIVVADVSGKGLQSAMLMSMLCHCLRSQAGLSLSPREVIDETEGMMLSKLDPHHFVTLFYAILDRDTMTLKCANAGHPPLLLGSKKTGETEWIHPHGHAIGLIRNVEKKIPREEIEMSLTPGDFLFFYTDGITEARNSQDDCYGRARLRSFFKSSSNRGHTSRLIIEELRAELNDFSEGSPQQDDVTAVYLERCA